MLIQEISDRSDFNKNILLETTVLKNPILLFDNWIKNAQQNDIKDYQAFCLSTVNKNLQPSSRIVYLRAYEKAKYFFYTNYNSKKGQEIKKNSKVCLTFFWPELEQQIRIEGVAHLAPKKNSNTYFKNRPLASQIGAWASPQSEIIKDRDELEKRYIDIETIIDPKKNIKRPEFWGGYYIAANYYEFWQGRKNRLHDRIIFKLKNKKWAIKRLAP